MAIEVLLDEKTIKERIKQLSKEIEEYYKGKTDTLHAICVLKGSIHFFSELVLNLNMNVNYSFVHVSSYAGTESSGRIRVKSWVDEPLQGKYVLVVEDIVDTGNTLRYILNYLRKYKPADLKIVALIEKEKYQHGIPIDFVGFRVQDVFLIGYGLDYDEKYRNLPYIGYLKPES
ncbi:hypoxanthine phosphoribosyltransferase [Pseudothermotoga sp.]|nr:hypoxanthine phosphoribosyltransferase [Pseudothermotoga sp.]MDW8140063.1 hypoxanthine phosphoribosyltransferase [Pseudothermotoga sp.]